MQIHKIRPKIVFCIYFILVLLNYSLITALKAAFDEKSFFPKEILEQEQKARQFYKQLSNEVKVRKKQSQARDRYVTEQQKPAQLQVLNKLQWYTSCKIFQILVGCFFCCSLSNVKWLTSVSLILWIHSIEQLLSLILMLY